MDDAGKASGAPDHQVQQQTMRQAYSKPTLSRIGDMKTLTASGSPVGAENFLDPDDESPRP